MGLLETHREQSRLVFRLPRWLLVATGGALLFLSSPFRVRLETGFGHFLHSLFDSGYDEIL